MPKATPKQHLESVLCIYSLAILLPKRRIFVKANVSTSTALLISIALMSITLVGCGNNNASRGNSSTGQRVPVLIDDTSAKIMNQAHFRHGTAITLTFANARKPLTVILSGKQVFLGDNIVGDLVGDQIIGLEGKEIAHRLGNDTFLTTRGAGISKTSGAKWPDAVIPYVFDSSATPAIRDQFEQAVGMYNNQTVIHYVARTNQANYVRVVAGDGCSSYVGMMDTSFKPNGQELTLGSNGCGVGPALHEMGHAAGLIHEQQRPDRDNYININFNLIDPNWRSQYDMITGDLGNNHTAYDYNSIMHYGNSQVNGQWVMTSQSGNPAPQNIGGRNVLTASDLASFKAIYGTGGGGGGETPGTAFTSILSPQHTSGKCVDIPNGTAKNGQYLQQWDCNGTDAPNQNFEFKPVAGQDKTYLIKHVQSDFCLDSANGSDANGTAVQLYSCSADNTNQQWQLRSIPSNAQTFQLVAKATLASGKNTLCLDVAGVSVENGTQLQGYHCLPTNSNQKNQYFRVPNFH
jgi:hypothetical protein